MKTGKLSSIEELYMTYDKDFDCNILPKSAVHLSVHEHLTTVKEFRVQLDYW
jgi:hypothetical protein